MMQVTASNETVGIAGMQVQLTSTRSVHWQEQSVTGAARAALKGQRPALLWYTGLSGAGKSTIANLVDEKLFSMGRHSYLLDGDNLRHGLNVDLGFTEADRAENVRRAAEVARLMLDAGLIVGAAFISPFRAQRELLRTLVRADFLEIFVDTPLAVAEQRDSKGLYERARRGQIHNFTGVDSPYEAPLNPDMRIDTTQTSPDAASEQVIACLRDRGVIRG